MKIIHLLIVEGYVKGEARLKKNRMMLVLFACLSLIAACAPQEAGKGTQASEMTKVEKEKPAVTPDEMEPEAVERELDEDFLKVEPQAQQNLSFNVFPANKVYDWQAASVFPDVYTEVEGILTFRGNHFRNTSSYGEVKTNPRSLQKVWSFSTGSSPKWGGGAGWTGQPAIVKWPADVKEIMNVKEEFKSKENFIEVIYASLDGNIYFFDLESGRQSREPICIHNPIKGSVSVDPRGYPLLYVGQGIPQQGEIGFRIFSLLDGKMLHFIPGNDSDAYRQWGAFDGSALVNRETDTLLLGGENGLFYSAKLHTVFNKEAKSIAVTPELVKYRYNVNGNDYQGIENSVAVYRNLAFFADNGGSVQGIDLMTMKPIWALPGTDDTDASIVIDIEEGTPVLYTGTEVDKRRGSGSHSLIRKINGTTGDVIWKKEYAAFYHESVNGGLLATPIVGQKDIQDLAIFTIARHKKMDAGLFVALNKTTGEEVWRWEMPNYTWSSPAVLYDKNGKAYIIQCDSTGTMFLIDGKTGKTLNQLYLGSNIEASPAIFHDSIIVASRGGQIFKVDIR
ncbi:hypothetical protein [Bacillus sp. FJAT-27231]|uniref:hypothetical protein n=1 Tax=Bacillus sp. FJAT-27231 TaxID=1679168 RepID=UPI00069E1492|nr:hypothetical protein [Bacillus sp. FJAT-27231]